MLSPSCADDEGRDSIPLLDVGRNDELPAVQKRRRGSGGDVDVVVGAANNLAVGVGLVLCYVALYLPTTIIAQDLLTASASAVSSYFLVYFNVSWDIACFAFYHCTVKVYRPAPPPSPNWRSSLDDQLALIYTPRYTLRCAVALCLLYQVGNVLYFIALRRMSLSAAMVFYQASSAWVLLFSPVLLPRDPASRLTLQKAAAVATTLLGVGLIAVEQWHDGEHSNPVMNMAIMLLSGILWALYEVLFKRWLGESSVADSFLFVGMRGMANLLLLWPMLLVADSLSRDTVFPLRMSMAAWGGLSLIAALSVVLTLLITLGIAFTSPLFVRVGSTLNAPASVLFVDMAWNHEQPSWPRLTGALFVVLGFVVLNATPRRRDGPGKSCAGLAVSAILAGGVVALALCVKSSTA